MKNGYPERGPSSLKPGAVMRVAITKLVAIAIVLAAPVRGASAQFQFEVVHSFSGAGPGGRTPIAPLLQAADGSLWGTTLNGGAGDAGVVFQLLADRSFVARDLQGNTTGKNPYGGLIQLADGTLWQPAAGARTAARSSPSVRPARSPHDLPKVMNISGELRPGLDRATPVLAADGNLYAPVAGWLTISTNYYPGGIIRLTPQGVVSRRG
jgi:uncharacterized repeat protein (TIGR03803 family)